MENVVILDKVESKTYTIPLTWALWAKQASKNWEHYQSIGDDETWFKFADTCPYPEDLDDNLEVILTEGDFEILYGYSQQPK